MSGLDPADFRSAMARFASGVTIVTTRDDAGTASGFTASAFSSLSLDPPLVLVCLERKADCFDAFQKATAMGISILAEGQGDLAMRFATKGADKFAGGVTADGATTGMPLVEGAAAHVECEMHRRLDGGDHIILVGKVVRAASNGRGPLLHFNRTFGHFVAGPPH